MTRYLTKCQVVKINKRMINLYSKGEIVGVKDNTLLDSALFRPKQSVFGSDAYVGIYNKASALFHSLVKNHPFHNANKRTALATLSIFLQINGVELNMSETQAENFTVDVANDLYSLDEISRTIEENSIQLNG